MSEKNKSINTKNDTPIKKYTPKLFITAMILGVFIGLAVIIPGVSGKAYKLSEYTYRFASDSDRVALETAQGKTLDAIIAELNATITENRYKTLTVTDDGKVVCETVTESGSTVSVFTYFAVVGEDGVMTLYQTAAGREMPTQATL